MNKPAYCLLFGPFSLAFPQRVLYRDGAAVRLGSRATAILVALAEAPGELLSQDALIAVVWAGSVVDEGALRVHLSAVRKALGDGLDGIQYINNEPGRGYRFVAPLRRVDTAEEPPPRSSGPDAGVARTAAPPVPIRATAQHLPGQVTRMLGRDAIVAQLLDQLSRQRCVTVCGPGGIGKTTVALAVAHRYVAGGCGAAAYLDLAPICDAATIAAAMAAVVLAANPAAAEDPSSIDSTGFACPLLRVLVRLDRQPMLFLLDNCEHLVDTLTPLVERLLHEAPEVRVLLTSREPLRAETETVHRLAALDTPRAATSLSPAEASAFTAVQLFVARASEVREDFVLNAQNVDAICDICDRLDGVPLAIEFAAARSDGMDANAIAARLDERFKLLTKGRRTALPRQQTLRATLDWSYELLDPQAQVLLRRIALLANGFDMAAMQAIAGDATLTFSDVLDAAADLVAKSLLNCEIANGQASFHLLHTTRHYALDRLADDPDAAAVRSRHAGLHRVPG